MEASNLISNNLIPQSMSFDDLVVSRFREDYSRNGVEAVGSLPDNKKEQLAKDFESVLIGKLLEQVKGTIDCWNSEQDGAADQIHGMFWLYMARDIADKGGFGLWKDIYRFFNDVEQAKAASSLMDQKA